jgi:hypothetical protein
MFYVTSAQVNFSRTEECDVISHHLVLHATEESINVPLHSNTAFYMVKCSPFSWLADPAA